MIKGRVSGASGAEWEEFKERKLPWAGGGKSRRNLKRRSLRKGSEL